MNLFLIISHYSPVTDLIIYVFEKSGRNKEVHGTNDCSRILAKYPIKVDDCSITSWTLYY